MDLVYFIYFLNWIYVSAVGYDLIICKNLGFNHLVFIKLKYLLHLSHA